MTTEFTVDRLCPPALFAYDPGEAKSMPTSPRRALGR